jgi:hypothetical protein
MYLLHIFLWQYIKGNIYAAEVQDHDDQISCILVAGTSLGASLDKWFMSGAGPHCNICVKRNV